MGLAVSRQGANLSAGAFVPQIYSAKMQAKFYAASVVPAIANHDWEGDIANYGDKVIIRKIPTITVFDHVVNADLPIQDVSDESITLIIDKAKGYNFNVTYVDEYQSDIALIEKLTEDASMQMKVAVDSNCFYGTFGGAAAANQGATAGAKSGAYNLGTEAAPVTLTGANILQTLTALAGVLDEQNIPESERALVIDPVTRQLLMQSNLAQAQFMGDSQSMVRNGKIGAIDRFTVYVSNNLPRTNTGQAYWTSGDGSQIATAAAGTTNRRRVLMACHKSAISFASNMTKLETVRNPNDFGDFVRGVNIYGFKVTKPEGMAVAIVQ